MSDLISRQDAIATIEHYLKHPPKNYSQLFIQGMDDAYYRTLSILRALPSVQPTQHNTLKTLDCIDRQAAIDDVETVNPSILLDVDWVKRWVKALPSVQPEDCGTCKHGYFGDEQCNSCRVRFTSHYERRTDGQTDER